MISSFHHLTNSTSLPICRSQNEAILKYIGIEVVGYQQVNDGNNDYNAVVINVTNTGEEKTSLAIEIIARSEDGTVLDKSSVYAEAIDPGQTHQFYTFVYSELTPEQLKSAKYEIYKAYTYVSSGEKTIIVEQTAE